jgi:hypothetical protein
MLNRLLCDSNNLTEEIKKSHRVHLILYKIIKDLLYTELEIVYLALFLDKFGWNLNKEFYNNININNINNKNDNYLEFYDISFEENLFFIALFAKVK